MSFFILWNLASRNTKQKNGLLFRLFLWRTHISTNAMWWQPNSTAAHSTRFWWWFRNEIFFDSFDSKRKKNVEGSPLLRGEKKRKDFVLFSPLLGWWDFSSLPPVLITVCTPAVDGCGRFSREMLFCSSFFRLLFIFLSWSARLYVSGKVLARVLRYTHHLFTHTHTCCWAAIHSRLRDGLFLFFFPAFRSTFLFFKFFARLNFFIIHR